VIDWIHKLLGLAKDPDPGNANVDLDHLSRVLGCSITSENLFIQALRHRSLLRGKPDSHMISNERLEYLGDSVVGFLVAEHLFNTYTDSDEGFLTRLRSKLVNGRALAERARDIDLGSFIQVSDSLNEEQRGSNSILADAFEAIIGAIYLDQGVDAARAFIHRTVLHRVDLDLLARTRDNYKSTLLEYVQGRSQIQPEYEVVEESGPSHDKRFVVAVLLDGEEYGRGEDRSKKSAEQTAAKNAIETLQSTKEGTGFKQS